MRIYHNKLDSTLNQGFKPIWLVFGDEPWQKNDALEKIKNSAKKQGFDEIIRFSVDDKFNWDELFQEYQSMSLFSSLRIIEIEFTTIKIGDNGAKGVAQLLSLLHQDIQLIFHGPKLDAATPKRKWFKSLEAAGCYLPLYDIEGKQLKQWLTNQARQLQLSLNADVIDLMAELFEGNLSALTQELQKLSILFAQQPVSFAEAEQLLIKQAKFNPFQLIDTLLIGDIKKCLTILDQMQHDGSAFGQLVWFVHKEISQLYAMLEQIEQGASINDIFKEYRIWDKKKPLYQHALSHITLANAEQALARLAQVDLLSKTSSDFNAFILLSDVFISLFHDELSQNFSLDYEYN
ncbi:DNA polymerase III subunit delta [Colwellia sp. Arc7-635]|jgi:DNA polymerase-3 subunit delta|uniref:DNA polymerase III subunit delta n=1 Tax=Colwellia sp. Arc7-635 TaxID=2497879 RepID=UPI000F859CBE|nr:DNA polymerase III subunit delta [Colwellia sp. Arc7-635]AZQ85408.1 DNA polymerase III subunit delta [Colwellia sp. Arc7-635]